jgi:pyroglutamyl-peptidase
MKLLLTGFEPFLGEKINPSQLLVDEVAKHRDFSWVETMILPVSFKAAPQVLSRKIQEGNYKGVVMLGQAGGRDKISLERVALNWVESRAADETGFIPPTGPITATANAAYFCEWPLGEIKKQLEGKNIPSEVSFSAGAFVCNYLYFLMAAQTSIPSVFVHVPYLPDQTLNKPDQPSMDFSMMKSGIFEILNFLKGI